MGSDYVCDTGYSTPWTESLPSGYPVISLVGSFNLNKTEFSLKPFWRSIPTFSRLCYLHVHVCFLWYLHFMRRLIEYLTCSIYEIDSKWNLVSFVLTDSANWLISHQLMNKNIVTLTAIDFQRFVLVVFHLNRILLQ